MSDVYDYKSPFALALSMLRIELRSGRYVLGEQLTVSAFSRDLRLSATPVREAFSRLAGEGLIDDRRGKGYFAWRLDAIDLVELYDLQSAYLGAALAQPKPRSPVLSSYSRVVAEAAGGERCKVDKVEAIINAVVATARSEALMRANCLLADRLAPFRCAEAFVLSEAGSELAQLDSLRLALDRDALLDALSRYHARRAHFAADIVEAARVRAGAEFGQGTPGQFGGQKVARPY